MPTPQDWKPMSAVECFKRLDAGQGDQVHAIVDRAATEPHDYSGDERFDTTTSRQLPHAA